MGTGEERARRARRDVISAAVLANVIGAAAVFVFLQWLSYSTGFSDTGSRISAAIAAT